MVNHKNIEQFNSTDRKLLIYKMSNNKEIDYEIISRHRVPYVFTEDINYINSITSYISYGGDIYTGDIIFENLLIQSPFNSNIFLYEGDLDEVI